MPGMQHQEELDTSTDSFTAASFTCERMHSQNVAGFQKLKKMKATNLAYIPKRSDDQRRNKSSSYTEKGKRIQGKKQFDPEREFGDIPPPLPPPPPPPPQAPRKLPSRPNGKHSAALGQGAIPLGHAPPLVQGITLVPVTRLPDRLWKVFNFELFNAIQSATFDAVYESNDNLVVSAPTGSGKTTIMELAICKLFTSTEQGTYKIIYQAPTKALCSEKRRYKIYITLNR